MPKRVVILGGAGFIGTHLCLRLLEQGHEVFCVDIRDAAASPLLRRARQHPALRYVRHDIVTGFGIRCDEIYNLASPPAIRCNRTQPVETLKTDMQGSINALEAARAEHARVLYASSGSVGDPTPRIPSSANRSIRRILADGKRAAEALHHAYQAEFGVDTRIARIFSTYGAGAEPTDRRVVARMVAAALQNRDIVVNGSGEQLRTFCWVEDVAEGLIRLMEAPPGASPRTVDLGGIHEISIRALAEKIVALTGSRSRIVHSKVRSDDVRRRIPDLSAARRELDWEPRTPLSEGLRRTIEYAEKELAERAYAGMSWVEING